MSETTAHDSATAKPAKEFNIIINAEQLTVTLREISFDEVVNLVLPGGASDPNKSFTITYRKSEEAKHDGTMVEGDTIKIKEGTVFNVTPTTKS